MNNIEKYEVGSNVVFFKDDVKYGRYGIILDISVTHKFTYVQMVRTQRSNTEHVIVQLLVIENGGDMPFKYYN